MAVGFDVATESHTGTTGNTSSASFTWNHTGGASAQGALVYVFTVSSTSYDTSVTYDGTTMTAVPYTAYCASGENGFVRAYYLDNCGTGTKAVVVNRTNNATVMYAVCFTVTAASGTEVYNAGVFTWAGTTSNTGASSASAVAVTYYSVNVDDGSPGTDSLRFAGCFSGLSSVGAAGTGSTAGPSIDFGQYVIMTYRETTAGQGSRLVGPTTASGNDDFAGVFLAVREKLSAGGFPYIGGGYYP